MDRNDGASPSRRKEGRAGRNLLGRLNARPVDDLYRIAAFWSVNLTGNDRGRHVGTLYRTMTDIRSGREVWETLDPAQQAIVAELALSEAGPLSVEEIADLAGLDPNPTQTALVGLFQAGIMAREGDVQALPVGAVPRLFLPRELILLFRRLQDELDAGDLSRSSLRVLLDITDDAEVEAAAEIWGIRVIPGLRRRGDLIDDILRQINQPERIDRVVAGLKPNARALWNAVRAGDGRVEGAMALDEAIGRVWPTWKRSRPTEQIRTALDELETALLVIHAYRREGDGRVQRRLFVPQEILYPGRVPTTLPLKPLQPLAAGVVPAPEPRDPHALAWDLMTLLRELAAFGSPVWVPGEPLSRSWQRRLNGRLWFSGSETNADVPPVGYLGFLLTLGLGVGAIEPSAEPVGSTADRDAIRPTLSSRIRAWRSRSFAEQTAQLKAVWLATDQWHEGREREEIDVWGADWRGFRHRLLEALGTVSPGEWVLVDDLAQRFAEQFPTLVGTTFTAASARSADDRGDTRRMAIARIIAVEVETALWWFGVVDLARVPSRGLALRVTEAGRAMAAAHADADEAAPVDGGPPAEAGPVLTVDAQGTIELGKPAPIHIWSLTAFADAERLRPVATYQLRPGSIGRALGAGFDLDQIETYLERQAGSPLPEELKAQLRQWTISYRRVRLRRATVLHADTPEAAEEVKRIAVENGMQVLGEPAPDGGLVVLLPALGDDGVSAEDHLLKALRAGGYVGQWATTAAPTEDAAAATPEPTTAPNARRTRRPERS